MKIPSTIDHRPSTIDQKSFVVYFYVMLVRFSVFWGNYSIRGKLPPHPAQQQHRPVNIGSEPENTYTILFYI